MHSPFIFKTVETECKIQSKRSKHKNSMAKRIKLKLPNYTSEELEFLGGIVSLNPVLVKNVEKRMPKYKIKRFANACDVMKAFPTRRELTADKILNTTLDSKCLSHLESSHPVEDMSHLTETTKTRVNKLIKGGKQIDLSLCSPWLSKEKPRSAVQSKNIPLKGKIYSSVWVRHSVKDDFVVVQETYDRVGCMPAIFDAKATVAFPPICDGEIWTVGWIHALKKEDRKLSYEQNLTLVFYKFT